VEKYFILFGYYNEPVAIYTESITKRNALFEDLKKYYTTQYPTDNYYQIWFYSDLDTFAYLKIPINEETTTLLMKYKEEN